MTGGRIKRIQPYIGNEPFMMTYGDGVSDINIQELVEFHKKQGNARAYALKLEIQPKMNGNIAK